MILCQDFGKPGRRSPIVSFSESTPLLTSESDTAPLKAFEVLAKAHVVVCAHAQSALQVADPEGVDLPVWASLYDGDNTWRAALYGDQFLEGVI